MPAGDRHIHFDDNEESDHRGVATFAVCLLLWVLDWVSTLRNGGLGQGGRIPVGDYALRAIHQRRAGHEGHHLLSLDDFLRVVSDGAIDGIAAVEGLDDEQIGSRRGKLATQHTLLAYIVIVVGALGMANWLANRHNKSIDTTANKRFTLSDQTHKIVERTEAGRQDHVLRQNRQLPAREGSAGPL